MILVARVEFIDKRYGELTPYDIVCLLGGAHVGRFSGIVPIPVLDNAVRVVRYFGTAVECFAVEKEGENQFYKNIRTFRVANYGEKQTTKASEK